MSSYLPEHAESGVEEFRLRYSVDNTTEYRHHSIGTEQTEGLGNDKQLHSRRRGKTNQ